MQLRCFSQKDKGGRQSPLKDHLLLPSSVQKPLWNMVQTEDQRDSFLLPTQVSDTSSGDRGGHGGRGVTALPAPHRSLPSIGVAIPGLGSLSQLFSPPGWCKTIKTSIAQRRELRKHDSGATNVQSQAGARQASSQTG